MLLSDCRRDVISSECGLWFQRKETLNTNVRSKKESTSKLRSVTSFLYSGIEEMWMCLLPLCMTYITQTRASARTRARTHARTHNVIQAKFAFNIGKAQCLQRKCVFTGRYRVSGGFFLSIIWYYCGPRITVLRISMSYFYISGRSPWSGPDSSQGIYSVIVWREKVRPW